MLWVERPLFRDESMRFVIWMLAVLVFLSACQYSTKGLQPGLIQSQGYALWSLSELGKTRALHIYLEGDGKPWLSNETIARNPGPSHLVSLSLMKSDASAKYYLGRPCYFQAKVGNKGCHPALWTRARYSQQVVDVMVNALLTQTDLAKYDEWVLIGHSGGGTLAYLMAQQLPKVNKVIAISSNLYSFGSIP
jgi:hypothetical protein